MYFVVCEVRSTPRLSPFAPFLLMRSKKKTLKFKWRSDVMQREGSLHQPWDTTLSPLRRGRATTVHIFPIWPLRSRPLPARAPPSDAAPSDPARWCSGVGRTPRCQVRKRRCRQRDQETTARRPDRKYQCTLLHVGRSWASPMLSAWKRQQHGMWRRDRSALDLNMWRVSSFFAPN